MSWKSAPFAPHPSGKRGLMVGYHSRAALIWYLGHILGIKSLNYWDILLPKFNLGLTVVYR